MSVEISNIFKKNIEILNNMDKTIFYLNIQNYNAALSFYKKVIDDLMTVIEVLYNNKEYFNNTTTLVEQNTINNMLNDLTETIERNDFILLADLLEMQLTPYLIQIQEIIIRNEEFIYDGNLYNKNLNCIMNQNKDLGIRLQQMDKPLEILDYGYFLEYTSCGLFTLALTDESGKYYLHSNGQVLKQAGSMAREWFSESTSQYIIYGLGLGYHIKELYELDECIRIQVYESDLNIIALACAFTDLYKILTSGRVILIYDPDFSKLDHQVMKLNDDMKFILHYQSIRNIKNQTVKEKMEDYFINYSSVKNQLHKLIQNFNQNITRQDPLIDNLRECFIGKDLYVIAAGPSLDRNIRELENVGENSIILATGTVYKKLLREGIRPDYVIIIDANDIVYKQIEDLETQDIPLLYLSTVYYKVPIDYKGAKYIIFQKGFQKAEEFAITNGSYLYQTGGSVSTTAIEIGIRFKCRRIICVGLDLAYTDNMDHASGTPNVNKIALQDTRMVQDINGNLIATAKSLDIYRKWLEKRILEANGVEFLNATEGGANIHGMKNVKLRDVIEKIRI
jgi:hypothetical protein